MAADVGCTFNRITADESESALSDMQIDMTEGFISQVGLVPAYARITGYLLRGRQTCRRSFVTGDD